MIQELHENERKKTERGLGRYRPPPGSPNDTMKSNYGKSPIVFSYCFT